MVHQNILHAVLMLRLQGVDGVGNGRRVVEVFVLVEQFHSGMVLLNIIIWKKEKKKTYREKYQQNSKNILFEQRRKQKYEKSDQQNSMSLSEPVNRTTVLGTEMKKNTLTRCTMDISDTTTGFSRCC